MNRRSIIIASAGAALAAAPALAQAPMGGGSAPAGGAKLGNLEVEHGKKTSIAGAATLQTSKLALEKARDPKVRQFAQFEHDEQMTIANVLESVDPSYGAAKPDAKMTDVIQRMTAMGAGPDFDKAYVAHQIEGHQLLFAIQEDYLKTGDNRERVGIAKLARGQIKEHLAILADLQKSMS